MRIHCENCGTVFDLTGSNENSGPCPYCEHVNHAGNGNGRAAGHRARAAGVQSTRNRVNKRDVGSSTMIFPPDAETKPDPDTSIRNATNGKKPVSPTGRLFELEIVEGDDLGKRFTIVKAQMTIGRGVTADVQLKDPEVSREHCVIECYGDTLIIKDLRSANGTVLNGFLVRRDLLKPNDRIHVGNTTLEVKRPGKN
ncbi:MAG TPA: FHA domain-containing protein [Nitrospiria bacterium]|nr:FHA domain-containing protein [Nitrospiria bacterium]